MQEDDTITTPHTSSIFFLLASSRHAAARKSSSWRIHSASLWTQVLRAVKTAMGSSSSDVFTTEPTLS